MSRNGKKDSYELDTSSLPALPKRWCWTTLATVADIEGGITKDQKRARTATMREVPYLRVANVQRGFLDFREIKTILAEEEEIRSLRLQAGDILFTEGGDRDKLGRGWVWNGEIAECIHQNHVFRARPNRSAVDPKFVSLHGNHFGQKWFVRTGKQTTNLASINKGVLSRFPVPVAPLNEQCRIVAKIEELFSDLDAGVAALERVKANLKRYRASVLKAAVEGRLTEEWRKKNRPKETGQQLLDRILKERRRKWEEEQLAAYAKTGKTPPAKWKDKYKEPASVEGTNLPALPEGWCWTTIDAIAFVTKLAGFEYTKYVSYVPDGDLAVIKAENAGKYGFKRTDFSLVKADTVKHLARSRLYGGEVLMVFVGVGVGQVAIVPKDRSYFLGPNIAMIRVESPLIAPECVELFLRSSLGFHLTLSFVKAVAQPSLSMGTIRQVPIAVPPPMEQKHIVQLVQERLSVVEEVETEIATNLKRSARLRQAILKQAFEGRLVPQDPSDEPASVLLERIKATNNNVAPRKAMKIARNSK